MILFNIQCLYCGQTWKDKSNKNIKCSICKETKLINCKIVDNTNKIDYYKGDDPFLEEKNQIDDLSSYIMYMD